MTEWMLIDENAPRDGTEVLGYGEWAGEISGSEPGNYVYAVIRWTGGRSYPGYEWSVTATDGYAAWFKPTHYALVEPPE